MTVPAVMNETPTDVVVRDRVDRVRGRRVEY